MAKLFWLQPDNTIIEFPLSAEQNVIGRGGRSDIRIKHPGISSEHALIRIVDSVATIEDMDSTNGTRINGRAAKRHTLRHGDQIEIGRERLMYFAELDTASRFAQPEPDTPYSEPGAQVKTVVTDAKADGKADANPTTKTDAKPEHSAAAASMRAAATAVSIAPAAVSDDVPAFGKPRNRGVALSASVVVLSGTNTGKRFPLDKEEVTLGKEGRQVIAIERSAPDLWSLRLKDGATPPYINGDAIVEARPLASGDVIELIGIKLRFEMAVASATS